ncbi:MAG TPA: DUF4097 family beta strand repeat-containing protein [Longimicrobiales bacterium]|nr:DUF4097 family beta strand repeat-containing protein [Longimicrobiales bacterium]
MRNVSFALLAVALTAGAASGQRSINETRDVSATGTVQIENLAGSVRVIGWNRDQVQVTGSLAERAERLDFTTSGSMTRVEVVFPRQRNMNLRGNEADSDLEIRVPARSRVVVETVSADITASELAGRLDFQSVSGDIDVRARSGQTVRVESVSGTVAVAGAIEDLRASSVSGQVRVSGVRGSATAETVSGEVVVTDADLREGTFKAVSGTVRYEGGLSRGTFNFESFSGRVILVVPGGLDANFDVSTFSGAISSDFEATVDRQRYTPAKEMRFTVGSGDARVIVKSFSGSVEIRRR